MSRLKGVYSLLTLPLQKLFVGLLSTQKKVTPLSHIHNNLFKLLTLVVFLTLHNYSTTSLLNDTEKRTQLLPRDTSERRGIIL
jgi:hypothetical protein